MSSEPSTADSKALFYDAVHFMGMPANPDALLRMRTVRAACHDMLAVLLRLFGCTFVVCACVFAGSSHTRANPSQVDTSCTCS